MEWNRGPLFTPAVRNESHGDNQNPISSYASGTTHRSVTPSLLHIALLGAPPPQVVGPLARQPVAGLGVRGAGPGLGVGVPGGGGRGREQGLLAGPPPVRPRGDPENQGSVRHQQQTQHVDQGRLRGGVLILRVVPLRGNETALLLLFLLGCYSSYLNLTISNFTP